MELGTGVEERVRPLRGVRRVKGDALRARAFVENDVVDVRAEAPRPGAVARVGERVAGIGQAAAVVVVAAELKALGRHATASSSSGHEHHDDPDDHDVCTHA